MKTTRMRPIFASIIAIFLLALVFQFAYPNHVYDPDSFYHIKHAYLYRDGGLATTEFPWVQYSVISKFKADLWYGFHLFLIPFTYLGELITPIKLAAVLITAAALIIYFLVLKNLNIRYSLFWTLFLFFSLPDINYRLQMMRPHVLTFALSVAIFYFAVKKKYWLILGSSIILSFFHLALAWVPLLIIAAVETVRFAVERNFLGRSLASAFVGGVIGLLLRPNFWGALKLAYIQVVEVVFVKLGGAPIRFGSELWPINWAVVKFEILPILLFILPSFIILVKLIGVRKNLSLENKIVFISSGALVIIWGLLLVFTARRAIDFWTGFSLLFAGLGFTFLLSEYGKWYQRNKKILIGVSLLVVAVMIYNTFHFTARYRAQVPPANSFAEISYWLKKNSQEEEIVFNVFWGSFPMLFAGNDKNYYINGMDPIFQYAFDKNIFWKHYFIDLDRILIQNNTAYTCSTFPCRPEAIVEVYPTLKNDFKAGYVVVEFYRNKNFYNYLESDERFEKILETPRKEALFRVL